MKTLFKLRIGPTNTRLRAHLGLMIPDEGLIEMRIANDKRLRWSDGKIFVIDDSFEHGKFFSLTFLINKYTI